MNLSVLSAHGIAPSIDVDTLRSVVTLLRKMGKEISGNAESMSTQVSKLREQYTHPAGSFDSLRSEIWQGVDNASQMSSDELLSYLVNLPNVLDQLSKDLRSYRDFMLEEHVRSSATTSGNKSDDTSDYTALRTFADSLRTMLESMGTTIPSDLLRERKTKSGTTQVLDVPSFKTASGRSSKYSHLRFSVNGTDLPDTVTPSELAHRYLSHGTSRFTTKDVVDAIGDLKSFAPGSSATFQAFGMTVTVSVPADAVPDQGDDTIEEEEV